MILLFLVFLIAPSIFAQNAKRHVRVVIGHDGIGTLVLPDGSKFKTTLYGLKVVGKLRTGGKLPYYILSGVGCDGCDANTSIYIHSPSDGSMKNEGEQQRFEYPGRELYYVDRTLVYESRTFFGNCLAGHPDAVVWFEKFVGEDKNWHSDVQVAEVKSDNLVVNTINHNLPSVGEAEHAVRIGQCQEIPGTNRFSEP